MGLPRNSKVMAFLATTNTERTTVFYRDTLGLRLVEDSEFALVFDANGTRVRVQKVNVAAVPPYTALGWRVSNIAEAVSELTTAGVAFERFEGLWQDDLGIWSSPSGAKIAWFKDPEGFILSLTQFGATP